MMNPDRSEFRTPCTGQRRSEVSEISSIRRSATLKSSVTIQANYLPGRVDLVRFGWVSPLR